MKTVLLLLSILACLLTKAQPADIGKRTTIVFVTSEVIAAENFKKDAFIEWVKSVQAAMGQLMQIEKGDHVVKIISRWKKDQKCVYDISVCPENSGLAERTLAVLKPLACPVAEFTSFELMMSFKFNAGCNAPQSFSPVILTSPEKMKQQLNTIKLGQARELIRSWARDEVIPVLSHFTISVDPQFEGVRYTGDILDRKAFSGGQLSTVTDKEPRYWRGVMEMNKGNLIISLSKVFMHVAEADFDIARRYVSMLSRFADKESLATHYLVDLNRYFDIFYARHDSMVREGITLHDKDKYDEAIKIYNTILKEYPSSAWALYELYFSTNASNHGLVASGKKTTELWNKHKSLVYAADPLYPMGGGANNARDGYMLFRHMQVKDLFKDSKKLKEDLFTYASIALDLEAYSFAGHLYWYLVTVFPEEKFKGHGFLALYFYSLQKMGVTAVQNYFKDDYKKELQDIDREREEAMKNDPIYKSFKEDR